MLRIKGLKRFSVYCFLLCTEGGVMRYYCIFGEGLLGRGATRMFKLRKNKRMVHTGKTMDQKDCPSGEDGDERSVVTAQDWESGGEISPLEFKSLEMVNVNPYKGLEDFVKAVDVLCKMKPTYRVSLSVVYIPLGKSFSLYEDGYRRTCAIVEVKRPGHVSCYILEVGRADGWSISTLFAYPISAEVAKNESMEIFLAKAFIHLRDNSGHWEKEYLQSFVEYNFDKLKHITKQSVVRWGERTLEKIL